MFQQKVGRRCPVLAPVEYPPALGGVSMRCVRPDDGHDIHYGLTTTDGQLPHHWWEWL